MALSRTHPSLMSKLEAHLRYSFDDLLVSHVPTSEIPNFRALLLDTRAVISGSTALHFLFRDTHWTPGDLDLYAPFGTGYTIAKWLIDYGGYRIVSDGSRNFSFQPYLVALPQDDQYEGDLNFTTHLLSTPSPQKEEDESNYEDPGTYIHRVLKMLRGTEDVIDIVESSATSFLPPITRFHSTLVMNYLTPKSLVVLYPGFTLKHQGVLQKFNANPFQEYDSLDVPDIPQINPKEPDYMNKYKARGFTLSTPSALQQPCGAACPDLIRTISEKADEWALEIMFSGSSHSSPMGNRSAHVSTTRYNGKFRLIHLQTPHNSNDYRLMSPLSNSAEVNIDSGPDNPNLPTRGSRSQSAFPIEVTRPPLPATSWSLRVPQSKKKFKYGKCANQFCAEGSSH